jgi:hypothetical protein
MLIDLKTLEQTIIETILRDLFNSDEDYRTDAEDVARTVIAKTVIESKKNNCSRMWSA